MVYGLVIVDTGTRLEGHIVTSMREVRRLAASGSVLDYFWFDDVKKKGLRTLGSILKCPQCQKLLSTMLAEAWNNGAATVQTHSGKR